MRVPGADHEQAGVLALRARVGLQRDRREARDLAQAALEAREHVAVADGLVGRRERVQVGDLGPGDRQHLARAVELHRARAQRDHRGGQRQVEALEPAHVAQHLVLGVVALEDRVLEIAALARQRSREARRDLRGKRLDLRRALAEDAEQVGQVGGPDGLVERDADVAVVDAPQVDAQRQRAGHELVGHEARRAHAQRVEEGLVHDGRAERAQARGQRLGQAVDALGDAPQAFGPVVDRVHAGHHGEQHLRRADVARGLVPADVLLARLQGHAQRAVAEPVARDADDAAGHLALVLALRGQEGRVRAAVAQGHAEALRGAHADVGAELAGRAQQAQREQVGGDAQHGARGVGGLGQVRVVLDRAVARGVLHEHAAEPGALPVDGALVADQDLDAERLRARAHDRDRLRVAALGDEELGPVGAERVRHAHGLGRGRGLVEQRRVRERQAGQLGDHGLEVEQRLEAALRDLGLVGRVLGVPARVLEHVALDDRGHDRPVVAHAQVRAQHPVLPGDAAQALEQAVLALRRSERELAGEPDVRRNGLVDELLEARHPERLEHRRALARIGADVTGDEGVGGLQEALAGAQRSDPRRTGRWVELGARAPRDSSRGL